ncbi:UbiA prenyltransferase family, partial [Rhizoctonia solani]
MVMNYGAITSYISSAALAPKPTVRQHFVMLLKSSRPPGWTFGPILYGIGVIYSGIIPNSIGTLAISAFQIVTLSFPLCTIVFGINDIHDYKSDLLNPRKSVTSLEGTILPPAHHDFVRKAAIASSVGIIMVSMIPSFYITSGTKVEPSLQLNSPILSTAGLVALGWVYSAPPLRLKEIPIIDSISNGVIVWLSCFIGFSSARVLTGNLNWGLADIPAKGYILGLVTASVHALGAAADVEADIAAGQRTIATQIGRRGCALIGTAAYATALVTEATEGSISIFGVYLVGGLGLMLSACVNPSPIWVHRAFQAIVYWTVVSSVVWFGVRFSEILN